MAAKLLHSLADENPDLQKQIGCMNGIFQIFDRQQLLSGRRLNQKKLLPPPPGNSEFNNDGDLDADSSNSSNRETLERNPNTCVNEKRASTESSRASFSSSSRSSSFSSLDCGRIGHPEPSLTDRIIFPETPSRDSVISQTSASPKMGRLSVDIRDVVKDSMNRDSRGLSVQTTVKEDGSGGPLKPNNSPRTLQSSKSVDGSGVGMKGNSSAADIKESLRVLAKLRDAEMNYNERELLRLSYESKERSFFPGPRDAPRFSCDGREINRKIKDLPRLSLDSRESSARGSNIDSKLNNDSSNERGTSVLQPPTNQSRPSSVVAKLMGLDLLPDARRSGENQVEPIKMFREDSGPSLVPLRVPDACRPVRLPKSPRSTRRESTSPRWKNTDTIMKPVSSSKIPIEPAPWKHMDGGRVSPKQVSKQMRSSPSTLSTSPSVYGEIEKRLKDIEFKQSGKDLRALKQILEAMQAKGLLEATKEEQCYDMGDRRDHDHRIDYENSKAGMMSSNDFRTNRAMAYRQRGSGTSKAFESPIVIMKPAKLVQKSGIPASSIIPIDDLPALQRPQSSEGVSHRKNSVGSKIPKDQTTRDGRRDQAVTSDKRINNRNFKVTPTSSRPPPIAKDNTTSLSNVSPRLQQKKLEFDKRSRPPTPPADLNKSRRQPAKQSTESISPGGRRRLAKISSVQQNDDQSSEKCNNSSNLLCQEDNVSMHSDTNLTLEPRIDGEGMTEQHEDVGIYQSPSGDKHWVSEEMKEDVSFRLNEEPAEGNLACALEQPSPVSVLDSSALREGSLSPVKQTSHALEVAESNDTEEELWSTVVDVSAKSLVLELPSEISRKKLQSIDNLVQKLTRLNSTHDEAQTDYIASLCENTNPDHRYVSEILLASGLLLSELSSGLKAFKLHPSGHPINPELFYVLEQTKASSLLAKGENVDKVSLSKSKPEKIHRKLIFDAVNEILTEKLARVGPPPEPWLKPAKIAKKTFNAQKLLRELCSEIEVLQAEKQDCSSLEEEEDGLKKSILREDVMNRSGSWTDFQGELSSIVLDVERSIFKELVNEIVIGEAAHLRQKPSRRCRQLFSK